MFVASLIVALWAQDVAAPAKPKPQLPADLAAYQQAGRLKDPREKMAAYEKFLKEFPASAQGYAARRAIFETTVGLHGGDRGVVVGKAKELLKQSPPEHRIRLATAVARKLHEENLLAADALRFARQAVKLPGTKTQVAAAQDALGRIYRKAGDQAQAERWLKRALDNDSSASAAALALGEMAAARGRQEEALAYFSQARLGAASKETRAKLEAAWQGSREGLERYLDERYRKLFPSPVHAAPYAKPAKRTGRVVLAEVHTGAGCGPCLAADLAFDAVLERYARQDVAVVMYHQHIPRPDPMANDASVALWKERKGRGVPTFLIDGQARSGGGLREHAVKLEEEIRGVIEKRLEVEPGASLQVEALREGRSVRVRWQASGAAPAAKLRLVLVEKLISYSGENGVRFHPMVARGLHTSQSAAAEHVFDLEKVALEVKDHIDRFEKKDERHNPDGEFRFAERRDEINTGNLAVVAYVENEKEVLQAAYVDLRP